MPTFLPLFSLDQSISIQTKASPKVKFFFISLQKQCNLIIFMQKVTLLLSLLLLSAATCMFFSASTPEKEHETLAEKMRPSEEFYMQRAFPYPSFDLNAYESALRQAKLQDNTSTRQAGFNNNWVVQGPGNIGARVNVVAIHPTDENIIYAGFSGGGVFKTTDGGQTWLPIFDAQTYLSIGEITIDPSNPNTIYVGTGDPNISGFPFIGDGIYRSTDAGATWTHLGLTDTRIISKIIANGNTLVVSTMGLPFERTIDRGIYRSTDGGATWNKTLYINDSTGIIDMIAHPTNANIIFASAWTRLRSSYISPLTSADAKIYKSADGGQTWNVVGGGLPDSVFCRIGIDICKSQPNIMYASYVYKDVNGEFNLYDIFKSTDGGNTWASYQPLANGLDPTVLGGFGWYFSGVKVAPNNPNQVYLLGVNLWGTDPTSGQWMQVDPPWWTYEVHADKHTMKFTSSGNIYLGTDGGLYKSADNGTTWSDIENIPATQFYHTEYNPHEPTKYFGGAQDNGTSGGNAGTINLWNRIYGGDGFTCLFHPTDPNVMFASTQNGNINRSDDAGQNFYSITGGIDNSEAMPWDMIYMISHHNPDIMYTGAQRVYKTNDGGVSGWYQISGMLPDTFGVLPKTRTVTSIDESYFNAGEVFVGYGSGKVFRKLAGNNVWDSINQNGLPRRYITSVRTSPNTNQTVYATVSGYRYNDFTPHIYKSTNNGNSWTSIAGNLPNFAINDLFILQGYGDSIMFIGTDAGVYGTTDGGGKWDRVGVDMPICPVYDVAYNVSERNIIAGTHARSIMTYNIDDILVSVGTQKPITVVKNLDIFPNISATQVNLVFENEKNSDIQLQIINSMGQVVLQEKITDKGNIRKPINVQNWSSGVYFVEMRQNGTLQKGKFVVSK